MAEPTLLLERDAALAELHGALARARRGQGCIALVAGEAGAGKSTLVDAFLRQAAGSPVVLRGSCDPLAAPRPLGPLIDAARPTDPVLARRLAEGMARAEAFDAALAMLGMVGPAAGTHVFVIEDVHWADEATLDLVTFLGRRITSAPALLVLTHRDDEIEQRNALRARVGELSASISGRVRLAPLSREAVAQLAHGSTVDPVELHRLTGGNPFFVTEVLGAGEHLLPESVRGAVLARAARLTAHGRGVLDAAAIVPGRVERWLLDALAGDGAGPGLDECVEHGLLREADGVATFRHELARVVIAESLPLPRRRQLHRRALAALGRPPIGVDDPARLAFHAAQADDGDAVLAHAPVAAARAASMGGHREAARHLEVALRYAHRRPPGERARLLMRLADERSNLAAFDAALEAFDDAAVAFVAAGDVDGQVEAMVTSVRALIAVGRMPAAIERADLAARLVERGAAERTTALVAMCTCSLRMLARQFELAEHDGRRAMEIAARIDDPAILSEACIQSGIARAMSGHAEGLDRVRHGIEVATRVGSDRLVAAGHTQIGSGCGELRQYAVAMPALRAGIEFAEAREMVASANYMRAWLGRCELELGRWDDAAAIASALHRTPRCTGISRFVALLTLGWVRARRGDPEVAPLLDEALALARTTRHIQRLWPVAVCRAEAAWLSNHMADEVPLLDEVSTLASELGYGPAIEELAHWRRLADEDVRPTVTAVDHVVTPPATPFGWSARGDHRRAAAAWAELGCPYEEAMARFLAGDADDLARAHACCTRLGAAPLRERIAAAMREIGAPVPRGANASTRANPFSLTDRELDVLTLLATGRTDREIAARLRISTKTAGHHVSRVLTKLSVRSRAEAAVVAVRSGISDAVEPPAGPA